MGSPVVKAAFIFFRDDLLSDIKYVMLNPSEISISTSSYIKNTANIVRGGKDTSQHVGKPRRNVSMSLHFDLVQKYASLTSVSEGVSSVVNTGVSTVLSKIPGFGELVEADTFTVYGGILKDPTKIHLLNKDLTCYVDLKNAAKDKRKVCFVWGDMRFFGTIDSFSSRVDYFSKYGAPLRAEVNLSISTDDREYKRLDDYSGACEMAEWFK